MMKVLTSSVGGKVRKKKETERKGKKKEKKKNLELHS